MNTLRINHLAVVSCVVLMFALGFLWYGPFFGQQWMRMVDLDQATMDESSAGAGIWVTMFAASIVPLYVLAWLFTRLDVRSGVRGAGVALLLVFALHHLPEMSANMFAERPYGLAWITGGYDMAGFTISGFILGAWTKAG